MPPFSSPTIAGSHACPNLCRYALTELMNEWFRAASDYIHERHGIVDMPLGDSVLARWLADHNVTGAVLRAADAERLIAEAACRLLPEASWAGREQAAAAAVKDTARFVCGYSFDEAEASPRPSADARRTPNRLFFPVCSR